MVPSNSSFFSNTAIFHFHDCGRKSTSFQQITGFEVVHSLELSDDLKMFNILEVAQLGEKRSPGCGGYLARTIHVTCMVYVPTFG